MLTYHPAYDVNHCAYRMLLLMENINSVAVKWETLKFMDFYMLFPSLLKLITLPVEYKSVKKHFKEIPDTYESIANPTRLLFELGNIQAAGMSSLIARNLISKNDYIESTVMRTDVPIPAMLYEKIKGDHSTKKGWFLFLTTEFHKIEFYGRNGIKSRTGLMEYKYDIA